MRFSTIVAATAFTGVAVSKDITVVVGKGNLSFVPDNIEAAVGDTVSFHFWPKNHSVVQGAFADPCSPMTGGAWSGFVPTSNTTAAASTTFMMNITNTSTPIWLYCSQGDHCQSGMVAVINQAKTGNKTLDAYRAASMNASTNKSPSEAAGTGGMLMNGTTTTAQPGAASSLQVSSYAFAGIVGMMAYALL